MNNQKLWSYTLLICGISGLIIGFNGIFDLQLPTFLLKIIGGIDLCCIPILV